MIMIKVGQDQHIGPDRVDNGKDREYRVIIPLLNIAQQQPRSVPAQRRRKRRNPERL